ncbi:MAG: hypothetical protein HFI65_02745 [Lachnospiraceae bacterium]|nr:hypothetical protein [Lachnospiraceae bacterium]
MELRSFLVRLVDKSGGKISGRVRLQKLIYFCKALGADINVSYRLYVYGPFCQQVADTLQDCVMEDILSEQGGIIQKGSEFEEHLDPAADESAPLSGISLQIMEDVLKFCEPLSTRELEITATAFFIDRQQKVLFGCNDQAAVIDKVIRAKGKRFSREEIDRSYERVIEGCFPLVEKYMAIEKK